MIFGNQFREFTIIVHSGFIHCYHLELPSKNTATYKIRLRFCTRFMEKFNDFLLVFGIGKSGIPSIPSFYVRFHLQFGLLLRLWSNHSLAPRQGSLSAKTQFVGQRHTLPISRTDTFEVSTLVGCLLRDITSMYYSRLQSYSGFSNISLSVIFTLFPRISLHFIGVI